MSEGKGLQIESIVSILIKIADKLDTQADGVTIAMLHDSISVNQLDKLSEAVQLLEDIGDKDKQILLVQLTTTIMENVNNDLDRRNVAALIHLKVTLLKLLGFTVSAITIITVSVSLYTGSGNIAKFLSDMWKVLEIMFLK